MTSSEPSNRRAAYHHGDLKAELVRAGTAMLEEVGLEKLSLRGIAARIGVSHTAPQNHFHGLRGLLTAIAADGFRRHAHMMTAGLGGDAPRTARLSAAARGYVRFAQDNPALFRLMFSPAHLDETDPELCAAGGASYAILVSIAEGLDWTVLDGSVASDQQTELMLWSMVHGYAHLLINGKVTQGSEGAVPVTALIPQISVRGD